MNGISPEKLDRIIQRFAVIEAELGQGPSGETFVRLSQGICRIGAAARRRARLRKAYSERRHRGDVPRATRKSPRWPRPSARARGAHRSLEHEFRLLLLPKDAADDRNVILEVRAGTGGDEAAIFAGDLFRMYQRYAAFKGWRVDVISASDGEHGGYKEIVANIFGAGAYAHLKFESGVHRVQRVPATEAQGRIHTSAATVAVLPEAEDVDIQINDADLQDRRLSLFGTRRAVGQYHRFARCESRICRPASSWPSRTRNRSTRTRRRRSRSCAPGSMSASASGSMTSARRRGAARSARAIAPSASAPIISRKAG